MRWKKNLFNNLSSCTCSGIPHSHSVYIHLSWPDACKVIWK